MGSGVEDRNGVSLREVPKEIETPGVKDPGVPVELSFLGKEGFKYFGSDDLIVGRSSSRGTRVVLPRKRVQV